MSPRIVPEYNEAWNKRIHQIVEVGEELERVIRDGLKSRTLSDFRGIYAIGLTLQCLSHFRAAQLLVRNGFEDEVWILIRCMAEHIIKIKWCYLRKTNAEWLIIATERKDLNRLRGKRRLLRVEKEAIQALDSRLGGLKIRRNASCWDKGKNQIRMLSSTEEMARRAGLKRFYQAYFKAGSDRTHGRHTQLDRFLRIDDQGSFRGFVIDPIPRDLCDAAYSLSAILVHLLLVIQRHGWTCDQARANANVARLKSLMPIPS
jgi:uncharacterized protein DUF5677